VSILVNFISYICKSKWNDKEANSLLSNFQLTPEQRDVIVKILKENHEEIRKYLYYLDDDPTPSFVGLDWRFDVQIASRSFQEEVKPKIVMDLQLKSLENKKTDVIMECDYANLKHLTDELARALKQSENAQYRKFSKIFK